MNEQEVNELRLDAWKTCIDTQQHFNDICWKIRGLALTVLTTALGGTAVAVRDGTTVRLFKNHTVHVASLVLFAAALVWFAFFLMDRLWYHRLLIGAVQQGEALENELSGDIRGFWGKPKTPHDENVRGLANVITAWSPVLKIKARTKLSVFYLAILVLLIALAFLAQNGISKVPVPGGTPATIIIEGQPYLILGLVGPAAPGGGFMYNGYNVNGGVPVYFGSAADGISQGAISPHMLAYVPTSDRYLLSPGPATEVIGN